MSPVSSTSSEGDQQPHSDQAGISFELRRVLTVSKVAIGISGLEAQSNREKCKQTRQLHKG